MKRFENVLTKVLDGIQTFFVVTISICVYTQLISRLCKTTLYIGWLQEVSLYLLAIMSFLGAMLGMQKYIHIRIMILPNFFKGKPMERIIVYFSKAVSIIYCITAFVLCFLFAKHLYKVKAMTLTIPLPFKQAYIYFLVCFCFLVGIFYLVYHFKEIESEPEIVEKVGEIDG